MFTFSKLPNCPTFLLLSSDYHVTTMLYMFIGVYEGKGATDELFFSGRVWGLGDLGCWSTQCLRQKKKKTCLWEVKDL